MKHPDFYTGRMGNRLFQIAFLYSQVKEGKIKDWYVQDYRLFNDYKDEIKALFGEDIGYLPYVAMHIRRGKNPINPDEPAYSENPFYTNLLETDYYAKAIDHFPRSRFLIFSDDMPWAKENFQGEIFAYDESETDLESLNKMASCDGVITANSSFSYWAGYLCPHKNARIVCPSETSWYSDKIVRTHVPKEWNQIEAKPLSPPKL